MEIGAVIAGLADPCGIGMRLARVASWSAAAAAAHAPASQSACRCAEAGCAGGGAGAAVADRVELSAAASGARELSTEEQARVRELKQRDAAVRQHEAAHLAVAGSYARGGASYEYVTGPDGRRYAVGGEVQIDSSPVDDDPDATIRKMQTVRAAALAPADPSAADRQIAAQAAAEIQRAQAEKGREAREEPDAQSSAADRDAGEATRVDVYA